MEDAEKEDEKVDDVREGKELESVKEERGRKTGF